MAWDGYPSDPEAAVRRICGGLAPYLKEHELAALIESTRAANRRFSPDQCAMVIEISVTDCLARGYRFLGADNDPDYVDRDKAKRARNAACKRKSRAAKRSGRPRGRPKSEGIPAWQAAGFGSERSYYRHKAKGTAAAQSGSKNASPYKLRETREVTEFHCHPNASPDHPSGAPQAPPHRPIIVRLDEAPTGKFIDEAGDEITIPKPHETRDWQTVAMAGYRRPI